MEKSLKNGHILNERRDIIDEMTEKAITKPNATTYFLEDIVGEVLSGRVRIPDFQREFRWQWDDVRRLFDSIVRGYPIGSLLLWSRPATEETLRLGALTINAPKIEEALWVVDGQQRLTSLASALNDAGTKDTRFAISYDLLGESFTKATEQRPHVVPLSIIFDLQRLLKWFAAHPESGEYFDKATGIAKAIRQYTIPAYIVKQQNEDILRDIFDRMNNYGKRLTRAEVFSALHTGESGDSHPRTLSDIADHIDLTYGFGLIDEDTVLQAVLARRGSDVTRDIRIEFNTNRVSREFPNETVEDAYRAAEEALGRAIVFLQEDAEVPHFSFLTYRYLLVVLTRFFAHHPEPDLRNRELIRRWFWRAAVLGPAEGFGGWTQALRALTAQVVPNAESQSVQSLINAVASRPLALPQIRRFRSTDASSRIFLCALWALKPRSVLTNEVYDRSLIARSLEGRKTAVDIVFSIVKREPEGFQALSGNKCILLGDDSIEVARIRFANQPLITQSENWVDFLESHGLSVELSTLLGEGRNSEFLSRRQELLNKITNDFLARMTESHFEDTPPLKDLDLDEETDEVDRGI